MLRFDKLTVKAQEALQAAQEIGARLNQQQIEPLHLLAALVEQKEGVVPPLCWENSACLPRRCRPRSRGVWIALPKVTGMAQQFLSPPRTNWWSTLSMKPRGSRTNMSPPNILLLAIAALPSDPAG